MKKKIFIVAAVFFSSQSFAQQDSTTMDEVVVTATKTALKQSQTGKVVTVINQAMLQSNAGKTLTEILNYQAGIFVNGASSNLGSNQDYYLRGASTGNTLIFMRLLSSSCCNLATSTLMSARSVRSRWRWAL